MTTPAGSTRFRLDIAYDGGAFTGWTRQPGHRTVQGDLEDAIGTVLRSHGDPPRLTVAGRTDAGVHATGQVAHVDLSESQVKALDEPHRGKGKARKASAGDTLARRVNGIAGLNSDLHVASASIAPLGFDARFSAIWRRYRYRIADATAERNPLLRNHTVWYPARLEESAMDAAAQSLLGLHDWAAYCKPREGGTTVRTLQEFRWEREESGVLVASLQADAFCHSMVRSLVGACVAVGEGKLPIRRLLGIRDEASRTSEFKVMPAKGLVLTEVGYPPDGELAARVEQTRARRDEPV